MQICVQVSFAYFSNTVSLQPIVGERVVVLPGALDGSLKMFLQSVWKETVGILIYVQHILLINVLTLCLQYKHNCKIAYCL